jgi:hypothetical protein
MSPSPQELLITAESMKEMLVARATGDQSGMDADYRRFREALMGVPSVRARVPGFIHKCRTLFEFWGYIQPAQTWEKVKGESNGS